MLEELECAPRPLRLRRQRLEEVAPRMLLSPPENQAEIAV
jgi:hypothetical protein